MKKELCRKTNRGLRNRMGLQVSESKKRERDQGKVILRIKFSHRSRVQIPIVRVKVTMQIVEG